MYNGMTLIVAQSMLAQFVGNVIAHSVQAERGLHGKAENTAMGMIRGGWC